VGAISRYLLSDLVRRHYAGDFPGGTLLVNLIGCLCLGGLMTVIQERDWVSPNARLFLTMGVLGSLTTFSTFGYETVALFEKGKLGIALGSVVANIALGIVGVLLGRALVKGLL
jgi:CrcB protein